MPDFDYVIVGAGTAGAVLAARLSEDPGRRVLVLEAGPDLPDERSMPEVLRTGSVSASDGFDWGLTATVAGRAERVARGRVVGGSSQVNDRGAMRPPASDFAAWAAPGLPEWGFDAVLPALCRLETDEQFADRPYHGADGPVPITRWPRADLVPAMAGFLDAVLDQGHPYCPDMNAPDALGIGPYPQNRRDRLRMSTTLTYLRSARRRPNLEIRGDSTVTSVDVRDGRAAGVVVDGDVITAGEVVLCAGAPFSPALLLRSGIGPADHLREAGVPAIHNLPGVGADLIDQPGAIILVVPRPQTVRGDWPRTQLIARLAGFPGHRDDHAFYLSLFAGMSTAGPMAEMIGAPVINAVMIGDMAAVSRGRITLRGADPADLPAVDLGFYSAAADLDRMRAAYRHAWEIANRPAFTATVERFAMVDDDTVADDEKLTGILRATTYSRLNLVGGARMGPDGDPMAVVDAHCRVRGVANLRVADASVIPVPIRAPAALACMMLGEHVAGLMAAE